jgi:cysteinyl-tRNA synthetase
MLKLFNSDGKKLEEFNVSRRDTVTVFTCGPSVYQRAHIGNFRAFLFEDVLVRYLEFCGYDVSRGMTVTDIEDKAIEEAARLRTSVRALTEKNIEQFAGEMDILRMKAPGYMPRASQHVDKAVGIILELLDREMAYWHRGNVYFDPLKFPGFGKLYGLDMTKWPAKKRRFHKDTYPGMRWNRGDFILWHGYRNGDKNYWETAIGKGRPAWNIQDPAMLEGFTDRTLSFYCGGIDNLVRHHDYTLAIMESVRPYPVAGLWLHCQHLFINRRKMSKSLGNIYYTDTLIKEGFGIDEIRFLLIYGHYRKKLNYSKTAMRTTIGILRRFRTVVAEMEKRGSGAAVREGKISIEIRRLFSENMDNDLNVRDAFDAIYAEIRRTDINTLSPGEASGIIASLKEIDRVLQVIF